MNKGWKNQKNMCENILCYWTHEKECDN